MKTFPGPGSNERKLVRFLLFFFFFCSLNLVVTNEPSCEDAENFSPNPTNYLHFILFINCAYLCIFFDVQKNPEMVRTMANQCGIYSAMNNMQWWTGTMSAKVPHLCQELNFQLLVTVTFSGCNFRKNLFLILVKSLRKITIQRVLEWILSSNKAM